jgi:hypothetical protein
VVRRFHHSEFDLGRLLEHKREPVAVDAGSRDGSAEVAARAGAVHLAPMVYAVLRVVLERLRAEGRLVDGHTPPLQTADGGLVQVEIVERPPFARIRPGA